MLNKRLLASLMMVYPLVAACGGGGGGNGGGTPTAPPPANFVIVEMDDFAFVPKGITVQPGDTVRWIRRGVDPDHTTKSKLAKWNSGFIFLSEGDLFEYTFTAADEGLTFEYFCESHTDTHGMKGSVRVGEGAPVPSPGY